MSVLMRYERRAFSLLELVIVIIILGVVAAIAIPRATRATVQAREASLRENLALMRKAIELYAAEHEGRFPGAMADGRGNVAGSPGAFANQLTLWSDQQGQVADAADATHRFGPYLRQIPPAPVGPVAGSAEVVVDSSNSPPLVTTGTAGWVYNPITGEIIVNTDTANDGGTRTYDEY